jgi:phenylacetate-coenzyme A ligase PaaK-like adenylate-forming protein
MSYDGWMQFANSTLLDKYQRRRLKKMIEDMAKDSTKFSNRFRLDMVQRDIRNLLKFRDVA